MFSKIFYYLEPVCAIVLLITILFHCKWYGYNYKVEGNDKELWKVFGFGDNCPKDIANMGKVIKETLTYGTVLYLISLVLRFVGQFKAFSNYANGSALALLVFGMVLLTLFMLLREHFYDMSGTEITKHSVQPGFWIGMSMIVVLLVNKFGLKLFSSKPAPKVENQSK
jgi:hypothetical protein